MIRRLLILAVILILTGAFVYAQADKTAAQQQQILQGGHHFFVYPTNGIPLAVHLHGVSGEVHVWVMTEKENPANEEAKKLELIRKAIPQKSQ